MEITASLSSNMLSNQQLAEGMLTQTTKVSGPEFQLLHTGGSVSKREMHIYEHKGSFLHGIALFYNKLNFEELLWVKCAHVFIHFTIERKNCS